MVLVAAITLASCGVPTGPDSFEDISADVPDRISDTTTTTTTTTTTLPDPTQSTVATTTTTTTEPEPEPDLAEVFVYFVLGEDLQEVVVQEQPPVADNPALLQSLLELGPESAVRDSLVTPGLIQGAEFADGLVTIDLNADIYRRLDSGDRTRVIAQIALTYIANLRFVGFATFTFDGDAQGFPRGSGFLTNGPVSADDYSNLISDPAAPLPTTSTTSTATTSSSSTTTTTSVPDDEPDAASGEG